MEFRRKLYRRGSSWETTIPMPLLFALDLAQRHEVVFTYDRTQQRWGISFSLIEHPKKPPMRRSGGKQ